MVRTSNFLTLLVTSIVTRSIIAVPIPGGGGRPSRPSNPGGDFGGGGGDGVCDKNWQSLKIDPSLADKEHDENTLTMFMSAYMVAQKKAWEAQCGPEKHPLIQSLPPVPWAGPSQTKLLDGIVGLINTVDEAVHNKDPPPPPPPAPVPPPIDPAPPPPPPPSPPPLPPPVAKTPSFPAPFMHGPLLAGTLKAAAAKAHASQAHKKSADSGKGTHKETLGDLVKAFKDLEAHRPKPTHKGVKTRKSGQHGRKISKISSSDIKKGRLGRSHKLGPKPKVQKGRLGHSHKISSSKRHSKASLGKTSGSRHSSKAKKHRSSSSTKSSTGRKSHSKHPSTKPSKATKKKGKSRGKVHPAHKGVVTKKASHKQVSTIKTAGQKPLPNPVVAATLVKGLLQVVHDQQAKKKPSLEKASKGGKLLS